MPKAWRIGVVVAVAAALGALVGGALPAQADVAVVGRQAHLPASTVAISRAVEVFPYKVREPQYLPSGMRRHHAIDTEPHDESETAYSLDIWYRGERGAAVHVWQTDHPSLPLSGKDPAAPTAGESTTINDRVWIFTRAPDFDSVILSTRYEDGVTLSVDTNLSEAVLRRIAASIE